VTSDVDDGGISDHVTAVTVRRSNRVKSGRLLRVLSRTIDLYVIVFYQGGRRRVRARIRRVTECEGDGAGANRRRARARACQERCKKL